MSVRTVIVSVGWLAVAASAFAPHDQLALAQAPGLSDATLASGLWVPAMPEPRGFQPYLAPRPFQRGIAGGAIL